MMHPVCSAERPDVACKPRYDAVRRGTMWYSVEARGWLWSGSECVLRPWSKCPYCGEPLPTLTSAAEKLLRERDVHYDYGEGLEEL